MKKIFFLLFIAIAFFLWPKLSFAQNENTVNLHLFFSPGCSHCADEKEFLKETQDKYPQLNVIMYDVGNNVQNQELYTKVAEKFGIKIGGVPFTVVCDEYILGYLSPETTGKKIDDIIQKKIENGVCDDQVAVFQAESGSQVEGNKDEKKGIDLPIFGLLNLETTSLFFLTAAIGFLDGFNPCAMWTLLFLISLLLGIEDKKRRYFLGTAFILASGLVYFAFIAAWLNFFLIIGFVKWVRLIVAAVAVGVGVYNLKNFWEDRQGGCFVEGDEKRQHKFEQIKEIVYKKNILLSIGGIILLAFAVNMVELVCSAGFPAIYTQILAMSNLNTIQYYLYLLLYIFFFILDDLVVFIVAMVTIQAVGIENKYSRISKVVGGILMIIIGLLLIFNPQLLTFS